MFFRNLRGGYALFSSATIFNLSRDLHLFWSEFWPLEISKGGAHFSKCYFDSKASLLWFKFSTSSDHVDGDDDSLRHTSSFLTFC